MKKLAALLLSLLLLTCALTSVAETVSDSASSSDTAEQIAAQPATDAASSSDDTGEDEPDGAPEWAFNVSLTELESNHSLLVNRNHLLASDYVPDDMVRATVKCASSSKIEVCEDVNEALEKMFSAAAEVTEYTYLVQDKKGNWVEKEFSDEQGLRLILKSGYRSYGTQKTTYNNYLARNNGVDDGISSPPGASEHQSGMACDILSVDYNSNNRYMNDSFYQTPEAQWMADNCYSYGFILRYPEDKEDITKVPYEPWHLRYVGREIAGFIKVNNITLEEFTEIWQPKLEEFIAAGGDVEQQLLMESLRKANGLESTVLNEYGEDGDAEISLSF
ncbi:MAG: M15 family metallopeptidase [Eubacteriales bacterium]|nr:M15 family metallopeptidase [Eubacteriales bacterium]